MNTFLMTEISRGSFTQTGVSSPLMAEALAIREALLHASTLHYKRIWFRSDSQGLITAINSNLRSIELYENSNLLSIILHLVVVGSSCLLQRDSAQRQTHCLENLFFTL
ncbi:hypothetical protein YC2023_105378 [Brassica napus]